MSNQKLETVVIKTSNVVKAFGWIQILVFAPIAIIVGFLNYTDIAEVIVGAVINLIVLAGIGLSYIYIGKKMKQQKRPFIYSLAAVCLSFLTFVIAALFEGNVGLIAVIFFIYLIIQTIRIGVLISKSKKKSEEVKPT